MEDGAPYSYGDESRHASRPRSRPPVGLHRGCTLLIVWTNIERTEEGLAQSYLLRPVWSSGVSETTACHRVRVSR